MVHQYGTEQLRISGNGTYEQLFGVTDKVLQTINEGKWEWIESDGMKLIIHNPIIVDDGFGKQSTMRKAVGAVWPLPIKRSGRRSVYLIVNEDQGLKFRKIEKPVK